MTTEVFESGPVDSPVHPGEILGEELEARGLSPRELALQMGRPPRSIVEIVRCRRAISPATALDLERVLGVPARLWMNLQASYSLDLARLRRENTA